MSSFSHFPLIPPDRLEGRCENKEVMCLSEQTLVIFPNGQSLRFKLTPACI